MISQHWFRWWFGVVRHTSWVWICGEYFCEIWWSVCFYQTFSNVAVNCEGAWCLINWKISIKPHALAEVCLFSPNHQSSQWKCSLVEKGSCLKYDSDWSECFNSLVPWKYDCHFENKMSYKLDILIARRRLKSPWSLSSTSAHPTMVTLVNIMVMNGWLTSFSFHVNRPSHSWDKAISVSNLETPMSRSWVWSKVTVI